jgi:protein TonB
MNAFPHNHEMFNDSGCLSQDALEHYLQHLLTDDERKLVDDHLSSCPLCSDAIEGLSEKSTSYSPGIASHSRHINMRLRRRFNYDPSRMQSSRKGPALRTLLIPAAASIIIMLGIIGYFHYFFPEGQELAIAENEIPPVQAEERTIVMENEEVPNTSQTDHPAVGGVMDKSSEEDEVVDKVSIGAGSAVQEIQPIEVQINDNDVPGEEVILAEVNEDITIAKSDVLDESQEVYADEEMVVAEEMEVPSATAKSRAMREEKKSSQEMVFAIVEQMPEFPGGMDSLQHFLLHNLIYPENIEHKTDTTVIAQFIINKRGKIKNIVIVRSAGQAFDDEVIRVIKLMPDWTSGMQRGKPVSVKYNLPIGFKSE